MESDIINAEIVETLPVSEKPKKETLPAVVETNLPEVKKKKLSLKNKAIAEYAARCYPPAYIAEKVGLKVSRVYYILEENEQVWEEIERVQRSIFSEGDKMIANLRINALKKLDEHLSSGDADIEDKAIDKILKCTDFSRESREGGNKAIFNFFGKGGKGGLGMETIDELILKRRKERGLPIDDNDEEDK